MTLQHRINKVEEAIDGGDGKVEINVVLSSEFDIGKNRCEHRREGCPPKPCPIPQDCWYWLKYPYAIIKICPEGSDI